MHRLVICVALLAFVTAGCSNASPGMIVGPAPEDVANEPPYGPGTEVEKEYDYLLYVHCGVRWARVDGVWWQTNPLDDRNANPPAGWGNPYDAGKLKLVDRNVAVYHGGPGVSVRFERTELVDTPFACE